MTSPTTNTATRSLGGGGGDGTQGLDRTPRRPRRVPSLDGVVVDDNHNNNNPNNNNINRNDDGDNVVDDNNNHFVIGSSSSHSHSSSCSSASTPMPLSVPTVSESLLWLEQKLGSISIKEDHHHQQQQQHAKNMEENDRNAQEDGIRDDDDDDDDNNDKDSNSGMSTFLTSIDDLESTLASVNTKFDRKTLIRSTTMEADEEDDDPDENQSWGQLTTLNNDAIENEVVDANQTNHTEQKYSVDATTKAREIPNLSSESRPINLHDNDDNNENDDSLIQRYRMVERAWMHHNNHHPERIQECCTNDFVSYFYGPDRTLKAQTTLNFLIPAVRSLLKSCPNLKFMYRCIQESIKEPGVVIVHDFVATGKHTGEPFQFRNYPPLPAKGHTFVTDPSESHYHFDPQTNLICKEEVIALGEYTGLPGVYKQLLAASQQESTRW